MGKIKEKLGWFTGGGFEEDPFLTEADKRYYRKEKARLERAFEKELDDDWFGKEKEKDNWL